MAQWPHLIVGRSTGSDLGAIWGQCLARPLGGGDPLGCRGPSQPPGVALQAAGCWAGASQGHGRGPGWGGWNSGGARGSRVGGVSVESRARGRARGPQHRGSRRTARPELAARQQSPRGAARGRWDRPDLSTVPGALARLIFLQPRRERLPSRARHVRGWIAARSPAGPPARPPSHPPAGRLGSPRAGRCRE